MHHIYSNEEKFDNKEDENKIKEQEFIVQKLQIEITSDENKLEIITKQIEKLSKEVNILENLIQTKLNEFEKEYNGYKLNENWREMRQQKDIMISNLTEYQNLNKYIESGEIILPLLKSISKIIEEGKSISNQISEKIGDKNVIEEVSLRLQQYTEIETKINEIKKQIKSSENELEINKKEFESIVNHLENKVKSNDFDSIENAFNSRLTYQEVNKLELEQKEIEEEKNKLLHNKQLIEKDYLENKNKDNQYSEEELLSEQKEKLQKIEELEEDNKKIYTQIHIHQDNSKEFEQIKDKIQTKIEKNEVWSMLNKLIGDSQGDRFNKFVQDLTLIQLLKLAN